VVTTPAPVAEHEQIAVAPVAQTQEAHETLAVAPVAQAQETHELPHTAGSMPLIALLGGLAISAGLGLKLVLKITS